MKLIFTILLSFAWSLGTWAQTEHPRMVGGGPYILYAQDGRATVITFDKLLNMYTQTFPNRESIGEFTVYSHEGDYTFKVKLQDPITTPQARYNDLPEKMLILSDPHGDIVSFVKTLTGNKIVDEHLNWIYGNGHVKILGDIQDRGNDQTTIFWLVYKLQTEARKAGGELHYLLGNHEAIVAQHDERYLTPKYLEYPSKLTEKMGDGVRYGDLWGSNSELGNWVFHQNTIQIMGSKLFVHAGISVNLVKTGLTVEQINDTVRKYIALPRHTTRSEHATLIMTTAGPLWYRAMVDNTMSMSEVDEVLNAWKTPNNKRVEQVVTGHTRVNSGTSLYDGKVLCIDVSNVRRSNMTNGISVALYCTPSEIFPVTFDGQRTAFNVVAPPKPASED
jgi:hypothetical protein